jgi:hypothetical protein
MRTVCLWNKSVVTQERGWSDCIDGCLMLEARKGSI